jgi:hypothetical protein
MICESLGYFTANAAADAIAHHKAGEAYACEWYSFCCHQQGESFFHEPTLLAVGRDVVVYAIRNRSRHHGYMTEYKQAAALVAVEQASPGRTSDMLASWF